MNNAKVVRILACLFAAVLMLAVTGVVLAEEQLFTDEVELFSEGGFPTGLPTNLYAVPKSNFDAYMMDKLNAQASEIDISSYGFTLEEFRSAYRGMLNSHPDMFFVSGGFSYYTSGDYLTRIIPIYIYTGSELADMKAIFNAGVSEIVNYARGANTDVGRLLRASDYMCINYEYDLSYSIYSPELLFKNKTGVCQAYMLAYRAVLNELGITNITVTSDEMNHTWNMVLLDGSWYHIDVTWNDPIDDIPLRACHDNFLLSDAGIAAAGHESWDDSWETLVTASNTKYDDYFWIDIRQAMPMRGDVVYYVDTEHQMTFRDVYAHDLATGTAEKIATYDYGYNAYYGGCYCLWVTSDSIYYSIVDSFYRMPLSGGEPELIYTTGDSELWICYPYQSGANMNLYVSASPYDENGSIHTCSLDITYELLMNHSQARLMAGETLQLSAVLNPAVSSNYTLEWFSSDTAVATVDSNGLVNGIGSGVAQVIAKYSNKTKAVCVVIVNGEDTLYLPADILSVEKEAFSQVTASAAELPEGIATIGSKAFADNQALKLVSLPASLETIADDAFSGSPYVTLLCTEGSVGEAYAIEKQIPYVVLP